MDKNENIPITVQQSSGNYEGNHLIEKQLRRLTIVAWNRGPTFNLKRGKNEGVSKTTCLMKKKDKCKPTSIK